jgi:hypothetical protein
MVLFEEPANRVFGDLAEALDQNRVFVPQTVDLD